MKTLIIAEAGVNHNGSLELAKQLVDVAAEAGADLIKFQTFIASENITKKAKKANYQAVNTGDDAESQLDMVKKLELSEEAHVELFEYCRNKEIRFFSTAFDKPSIKLLERFDLEYFKVPSGELTNLPFLRSAAKTRKTILLSTGMSTLQEVRDAVAVFESEGLLREQIVVLHCNTEYPTPFKDLNLRAMLTLKKELGVRVGLSDHTLGVEAPIAAVALGAQVIEKHLTLDIRMNGPDHAASLPPQDFKEMVKCIRNIELGMGTGVKAPSESETANILVARKSIVARRSIKKGERFTEENLCTKRPGSGISPMLWDRVIGSEAHKDYSQDDLIEKTW